MEEDSFKYMLLGILVHHGEKSMSEQSLTHGHRQERVRQERDKAKVLSATSPHLVTHFLQLGPPYPPNFQTSQTGTPVG